MLPKWLSTRAATGTDGLEVWFQKVQNEIDQIRAASTAREGFLFFKNHRHTIDELLTYPAFDKISSFIGQIESVVDGWRANGAVSEDRLRFYYERRHNIEQQIGQAKADIILRKPTFWEGVVGALGKFLQFILDKLPAIHALLTFFNLPADRILPRWARDKLGKLEDKRKRDSIIEGMWEEES